MVTKTGDLAPRPLASNREAAWPITGAVLPRLRKCDANCEGGVSRGILYATVTLLPCEVQLLLKASGSRASSDAQVQNHS
eukprot:CAMPEP_0178411742 /NCGR_PEP_ID=MMETSP0689_2-20121128/21650_1 /TAXON_ID=160604 /ORGANISM="Amphidinium massartii, Strain CS-259" /LENGTH=79 /DNA_ID=CAMNT_0020032955 /DNA_START=707 /DNA_END=946 /DNA_ORIENTATION=-